MGGSRKEIGFTKQNDHKQIELGELKTSFLSGAWGEAEKREASQTRMITKTD